MLAAVNERIAIYRLYGNCRFNEFVIHEVLLDSQWNPDVFMMISVLFLMLSCWGKYASYFV